ncbi:MAG: NTP transferase domain-containing protein [Thermoanaerobaculia bacterium]
MRLGGVVPAAGLSRRMGREKILLRFGGTTALERVLDSLLRAGVEDRVAVLRPGLEEAVALARESGALVVINEHPEEEMLVSIRLGIRSLPRPVEAFAVWPADHPAVSPETVIALADRAAPDRVVVPAFRGRRGHPALVGAALRAAIDAIPPGSGLSRLWRDRPEILEELAVEDEGVVIDMNTPADYERLSGGSC